ncbi:hypothetical protein HBH98_019890 [Parastagonospora nodorum]|nr:hypothetical protein HBH49_010330 [Parastagonospora nodorum]KAH4352350.1 hypothetical protein HBH98_019890 [Parastagonospora nodorum]KAH4381506.1 hypothetical protein HBH97_086280 [Parastagonospora nodorum]KAH4426000.1 hypothetical protein HBH99_029370 [Parastagonospora nodorum]KAH4823087.1 hypothetical protein HBH61_004450 [Parastagonospora nodorum]
MELQQWIKHLARNFMEGNISWYHWLNESHCPHTLTLLLLLVMFLLLALMLDIYLPFPCHLWIPTFLS